MSRHKLDVEDRLSYWNNYVRSQSDVIHDFVPKCGGRVYREGETLRRIENPPVMGAIHLHDNPRTMSKQERELVRFWLFCLGFFTALAILLAPLWLLAA